jgi:hypothetical protein
MQGRAAGNHGQDGKRDCEQALIEAPSKAESRKGACRNEEQFFRSRTHQRKSRLEHVRSERSTGPTPMPSAHLVAPQARHPSYPCATGAHAWESSARFGAQGPHQSWRSAAVANGRRQSPERGLRAHRVLCGAKVMRSRLGSILRRSATVARPSLSQGRKLIEPEASGEQNKAAPPPPASGEQIRARVVARERVTWLIK